MALALLEDWCRIMSVDDQKSLMVLGIPVDCDEAEIQGVLQETLKSLEIGRASCRERVCLYV